MKNNLDMIVFGEDWEGHPSSTQHLIKKLSLNRKILWFNSIGLRRPKLTMYDLKRCVFKVGKSTQSYFKKPLKNTAKNNDKTYKNISVINALTVPVPLNKVEHYFNKILLKRAVKKGSNKNQIRKSVLWMSLPTAIDSIGSCGEALSIYYCCDDFSSLAGVDHKPVTKIEKQMIEKVDVIITSNNNLSHKFPTEKTYYIPHGVDYDLFSQPISPADDLPKGKKIAGFYGAIHEWLNVDLLVKTAKANLDWNFVFVGPVYRDIDLLKELPNVFFLGEKPHHTLPSYVQHWDVAMLPFNECDQITHCNPLKLREYMASGTAVLSTDFPAARQYEDNINIVKKNEDFIDFFQKNEDIDTMMKQARAQQDMQNESWEARARAIEAIIEDHL